MQDTSVAHAGDPIFVRVVDLDRNRDGSRDRDRRRARRACSRPATPRCCACRRPAPNTGVFVGYIATATRARPPPTARCRSSAMPSSKPPMSIRRTTPTRRRPMRWSIRTASCSIPRPARRSTARACASSTSPPGLPATVFGDDGVSRYPSEMVTGQLGHRSGRHAVQPARGRVPLPAGGAGQLSPRSDSARAATHSPRSARSPICRRCRARRIACSRVRSARRSSVTAAPAVAVDVPLDSAGDVAAVAQERGPADRHHRRLRAVHAHAAERERGRRVHAPCRWSTGCRPARASARARCA